MILIRDGYVIDPASNREGYFDLVIKEDKIVQVGKKLQVEDVQKKFSDQKEEIRVIDAKNKYVMPGFVDLHVHFREPGYEYKETIRTGAMAAAAGGYTLVCPMPNTKPVTDAKEILQSVLKKAEEEAAIQILPVGAITQGQEGKELVDFEEMVKAGAVAFSEDGKSVMNTALYRKAMEHAAKLEVPIFAHCEDHGLVGNGVMNEGPKAKELGLVGISNAVEDIITARDIMLAKETGVHLHLCHCSTRDSVRMIAQAKKDGLKVTGEVCPHHFALTEEDITEDDGNYKMNPPLRSIKDREALIEALQKDVIDVIATDHAPHSEEEKKKSFAEAPFGIVGLETAFSITMTELVKTGILSPWQMVEKMSVNPAKILGLDTGCIGEGKRADVVIADPDVCYSIEKEKFYSKGKNTPFQGKRVTGRVEYTIVAGNLVYQYH